MSEELKPCPFCGCTDNFITVTPNPFSNDIYSTTHCKCYATGPFIAENYLTGEKVPTREHMEERATERWNTRPIEDELRARIAKLEKDNTEFRQLIRDWSIVLDQNDEFRLWQVESVRQAMLEINKESEEC